MTRILAYIFLAFCASEAIALDNPVIFIDKFDRTNSSIVVQGVAKVVPPGTKMWVTVRRYNGKPMADRIPIKTVDDTFTASDGTFVATLKKYGSLDRFDFPDGKYELEFYAGFNRAWQTIEVAKRAGVKLDDQGRSDLGEPRSLPKSSDLVAEDFAGEKVRLLRAIRTIDVKSGRSSFKAVATQMRDPRADIDLTGARAWLRAADTEIKKARALISNSPTDAMIGAQSRRIQSIKDQGLAIFPMNPNWTECRGVAANIWPLWWHGFRGAHEGIANAKQDAAEYGQRFQDSIAKCRRILG
jgi:hypothetical protein